MSPYLLTLAALALAVLAQSVATGAALQLALAKPYRRSWMALAVGSGLLALHHGYSLEFVLHTGLYDLRQAGLSGVVSLLLAAGLFGLKRRLEREPETLPPR